MFDFNREDKIRKDVTLFYDNVAPQFSQTRKNWWEGLNFFKKYIKDGDKLLDFGCGNGRLLEFIYGENLKVDYQGIDISRGLIELAREKYKKERFSVLEEESKTGFNRGQFDVVVSIAVFHHFNPKMAEGALKEIRRTLRKDGTLIITAWYLWNKKRLPFLWKSLMKFSKTADLPFSYSDKQNGQKTHWRTCYWWSKRELERVVKQNGFKILESGYNRDQKNNKRNIYLVCKKI